MAKDAAALLKDYGYAEVSDGLYVPGRPSSERWEKVKDGWHCYAVATPTIGGGQPWGKPLDGGLVQVPYTQSQTFENVSGLHPARNPEAFKWVWPEERVAEIYTYATPLGADSPAYRKVDGKYVKEA